MTDTLEPYYLYERLRGNEPHDLKVRTATYTFKFYGPELGKTNNWLEVTREDGLSWRFGPGHEAEQVWRALKHIEGDWEKQPCPVFKERKEQEFKPALLEDYPWETLDKNQKGENKGIGFNHNYWLSTADGFLGYPGPVSNHNRGIGAEPEDRIKLTDEEHEVLQLTPWSKRVRRLTELRRTTDLEEVL
jgi:hypothetical protein